MRHRKQHVHRLRRSIKYAFAVAVIISFSLAFLIPDLGGNAFVHNALTFIGILFAILVGFFITDLYTRYVYIRQNASADASNLASYFFLASILAAESKDEAWLEKVRLRIKNYIHEFMPLPWEKYGKTEQSFAALTSSVKDVDVSTLKSIEAYRTFLAVYTQHSTNREALIMFGKDKLSWGEWLTLYVLGGLLAIALFLTKDHTVVSILFTGGITSAILILFILLRDLNNLNFGENAVSIEPYERVLDTLGEERYYSERGKRKD